MHTLCKRCVALLDFTFSTAPPERRVSGILRAPFITDSKKQ
ncbi:hypothetical protein C4J83_2520 [Pseudomonas sp. LBUM920]|nr:hypothetical protein C4J83_2520 [Pseudomonas sp. LBUM920]